MLIAVVPLMARWNTKNCTLRTGLEPGRINFTEVSSHLQGQDSLG